MCIRDSSNYSVKNAKQLEKLLAAWQH